MSAPPRRILNETPGLGRRYIVLWTGGATLAAPKLWGKERSWPTLRRLSRSNETVSRRSAKTSRTLTEQAAGLFRRRRRGRAADRMADRERQLAGLLKEREALAK